MDALVRSMSQLRAGDLIDYTGVWHAKQAGLELLFARFTQQPEPPGFAAFVAAQGEALQNFATFSATQAAIDGTVEGCVLCHGAGRIYDVKTMHGVK